MNKLKINVDRPTMSSKDISNRMNFEDILSNHKIMAKPFYKTTWFFGVTGLATISLIAGSMYSLNQEGDELYHPQQIAENTSLRIDESIPIVEKVIELELNENKNKIEPIVKTTTSKLVSPKAEKKNIIQKSIKELDDEVESKPISKVANESINEIPKTFSFMDLHPRISGKIDGVISKSELLDENGLTTNSDVEIVSFQLHLIEGSTSKVFDSKGNTLNSEMKLAIEKINVGEEVYFEKIQGKATTGETFRLSPIKYVLLN